jgi:hypothetical protein
MITYNTKIRQVKLGKFGIVGKLMKYTMHSYKNKNGISKETFFPMACSNNKKPKFDIKQF